jgi:hypothetical protein
MKKILLIAVGAMLMASGAAYAGAPKDNCGCGWGTQLLAGKDSALMQAFAAITNGCLGNQTFGITFGSAGCKKAKSFASNEELNRFVADNLDNLARDVAAGQGEYLDSLAELMEIPSADRPGFNLRLHQHYSQIFANAADHADVLDNIAKVYPVS